MPFAVVAGSGVFAQLVDDARHLGKTRAGLAHERRRVLPQIIQVAALARRRQGGFRLGVAGSGPSSLVGLDQGDEIDHVVPQASDIGPDVTERRIDFMRHPGGDAADGSQLFRLHELVAGGGQALVALTQRRQAGLQGALGLLALADVGKDQDVSKHLLVLPDRRQTTFDHPVRAMAMPENFPAAPAFRRRCRQQRAGLTVMGCGAVHRLA